MCSGIIDLDGRMTIEFGHSFDFNKFYVVTVLEGVALVLMYVHDWVLCLLDAAKNERLSHFSVFIGDQKVGAIVKE
jgi:hypothetical protein